MMHSDTVRPFKAYKNMDFLNSPEARSIRVQCELTEPAVRFEQFGIKNTIVFFGSARIQEPKEADKRLHAVEKEVQATEKLTPELEEKLQAAKALRKAAPYYDAARELAKRLTRWSMEIEAPQKRMHIITGGGPGIMEAANRGTYDAGSHAIGMSISLPFENELNKYCDIERSFRFHYFFVRKYWLFYLSKALVVFPGGFGTMDELFEVLTLIQTGKTSKRVPVVLFGADFWNSFMNINALVEWGTISRKDLNLLRVLDTVEDAYNYLTESLESYTR